MAKFTAKKTVKNVRVPGIFASNFANVLWTLDVANNGLQFLPLLAGALLVTTNYLR
jgi:hypothetical protein